MQSGIPSSEIYTDWSIDTWNFLEGEYPQFITSSTSAYLSALSVDPGVLTPAFQSAREGYTVGVAHDIDSVDITAILNKMNPGATITIDGDLASIWVNKTVNLEAAGTATEIDIIVTAVDSETQKTYTITVNREEIPGNGDGLNFVQSIDSGIFYREGGSWVHLQSTPPRAITFAEMTGGN